MKKRGIYIFVNPRFPDLVMFGYSNNISKFLGELNAFPGNPDKFHCYALWYSPANLPKALLRNLIGMLNPTLQFDKGKDFYTLTPHDAYCLLQYFARIGGQQR